LLTNGSPTKEHECLESGSRHVSSPCLEVDAARTRVGAVTDNTHGLVASRSNRSAVPSEHGEGDNTGGAKEARRDRVRDLLECSIDTDRRH
jgi:hypothetical protein